MRDYVLMTDSCCDLTDYMARELELEVLPLTMHMDGQDYPNDLAGSAISNEEFYKRIRAGKLATTSAVNVGQFQDAMRKILESGRDIVCVCFSSALSTTMAATPALAANSALPAPSSLSPAAAEVNGAVKNSSPSLLTMHTSAAAAARAEPAPHTPVTTATCGTTPDTFAMVAFSLALAVSTSRPSASFAPTES